MKISDYLDSIAGKLEHLSRERETDKVKTFVPELRDPEARQALAEAILAQFERWGMHELNQAVLLGVAQMTELKRGEPLPEDSAVLERVGHLLAIDRALLKRYPDKPDCRHRWLTLPQSHLEGKAPLEFMLAGGLQGIKEMRAIIETDVNALRL